MNSATTAAAVQYRLKEWAAQIRECQNRPAGMSVVDWCASHGITKANYYYRLRRVRQVCLENLPPETPAQQIVPVNTCILQQKTQSGSGIQQGLSVSVNGLSIHVTESTPMPLLAEVLKVVRNAE
ncbi:IS66 family insertion sequence element accessory protein TnpA [Bacteroides acidifaciens]|uniref:IS66 family insertion sequence element accessory protein TnpA n=1 Tax=Bacteroides acidifaciens TaxID=85831 RepID=UPI0025A5B76F|nr:IS66 family insertion sequence element accessory protein TnpB [Bacteroides acidifaciens]